jgi:hypothetical protein
MLTSKACSENWIKCCECALGQWCFVLPNKIGKGETN